MKIQFAPLSIPLQRRLQTASVVQWIFSFLVLGQLCIVLFAGLFFTRFWLVSALYAAWWAWDWDTPQKGGRRSHWIRNSVVWRYMRDYFPITLVKTTELDPTKNYIFGFHPHGVLVAGAFLNFCTEATMFSKIFPRMTPHLMMLNLWFRVPFFRDYLMSGGLVPSDKETASHVLEKPGGGNILTIAIGGAREALDARPGAFTLLLANRKGFVRLAITHGKKIFDSLPALKGLFRAVLFLENYQLVEYSPEWINKEYKVTGYSVLRASKMQHSIARRNIPFKAGKLVPLVPVFSFGENELFDQVENPQGSWLRWTQERLQKVMGISLPLFHARGIFQYNFGLLPYRRPIHTVVGKPIQVEKKYNPSQEDVDELHKIYVEELCKLFEEHKLKYNVPEDQHLSFI